MADELLDPLGAAGTCPTVRWNGEDWRMGKPTQRAKDRFCVELVEDRKRGLRHALAKGMLSKDEYSEAMEKLSRRIAPPRSEHLVGKSLWMEYSPVGPDAEMGQRIFIWALLAENHPKITLNDVTKMIEDAGDEIKVALAVSVPSFFRWMIEVIRKKNPAVADEAEQQLNAALPGVLEQFGIDPSATAFL